MSPKYHVIRFHGRDLIRKKKPCAVAGLSKEFISVGFEVARLVSYILLYAVDFG